MSSSVATQNGSVATQQDFSETQIDLIKRTVMPGANDIEFATFINLCKAKRLDPLTRQMYAIKQRNGAWQTFASIDGLRVIAQRTGEYGGQTAPLWCGPDLVWREAWLEDTAPAAAKVGVWKKGFREPTWAVATFKSYGAGKSGNWEKMPDVMLSKCAEALALRKAFPHDLSALYVREEFDADELQHNAPQATVTPLRATPVVAELTPDTGEIRPSILDNVKKDTARLADLLKLTPKDVAAYAKTINANYRTVEGATALRDALEAMHEAQQDQGDGEEDYEGIEAAAEQPTLLDAEIAPVDRWADD